MGISAEDMKQYALDNKLLEAVKQGNIENVKELLSQGADINISDEYGETPLHSAALYGHLDVVKYLVEQGADVDVKNKFWETPLDVAENNKYPAIVKYLVEQDADVDAEKDNFDDVDPNNN